MSGYKWDPVIRVVPVNGSESVYWLADRLTDLGSHTRLMLRYVPSMSIREDVNRSLRPIIFGLRPEVEIECLIVSMADHQFLAEIESALLQPEDYAVFLSLDGGVVERQVVLTAPADAMPIGGKTVVGAAFKLALRCVDLIPTRPAMMTDPGVGAELLPNGSMEQWDAGAPQGWSGSSGVGTVAQEGTIIADGAASAKVTRSDAVTYFQLAPTLQLQNWKLGVWYRARVSARSTAVMTDALTALAFNNTRGLYVQTDGKKWLVGFQPLLVGAPPTGSFQDYESYFRMSVAFAPTDNIAFALGGYWTATQSLYYDKISVYGPVLRPGYATW